jgi:hypothetical protein
MMYNAGSIDKKSIVTNRQDALRVMRLFKAYGDRAIDTLYKEEEQVIRNRKKLYATILKMEPMTTYVRKGEQRIPTSHARDIVLCLGPLVCVPLSTFDAKDGYAEDLKELTFKLLKILVDCCEPSPFINGSYGDLKMCCAALKCIWSQMIMDGAEETDEKVEKSWLQFMYHEGASLIKSMCGKFILDFEKVFHALPDTGDEPVKAWGEFEARVAKDFAISKGSSA